MKTAKEIREYQNSIRATYEEEQKRKAEEAVDVILSEIEKVIDKTKENPNETSCCIVEDSEDAGLFNSIMGYFNLVQKKLSELGYELNNCNDEFIRFYRISW